MDVETCVKCGVPRLALVQFGVALPEGLAQPSRERGFGWIENNS